VVVPDGPAALVELVPQDVFGPPVELVEQVWTVESAPAAVAGQFPVLAAAAPGMAPPPVAVPPATRDAASVLHQSKTSWVAMPRH
jgi:hypothetical protein